MNVVEIFNSIDGEGRRQGQLATFLRLHDCNIRCSYCDTTYSYGPDSDYDTMTVEEVVNRIEAFKNHRITITGGEPLLQEYDVIDLVDTLYERNRYYDINIETNGTIVPSFHRPYVWFTYDYKMPSSLAEEYMDLGIFKAATEADLIKFVVSSENDLDRMHQILADNPTKGQIYVSPVWGAIEGATIVEYMIKHNLQDVRLQLQIHKFIWDPNAKGV